MSAILQMTPMLAPSEPARAEVGEKVVWQDEVPSGQVVTMVRCGKYTSRIMQNSNLDGWEDSTSSLRRAKILHDGFVSLAKGAKAFV